MKQHKQCFVYIMASESRVMYVGYTNSLEKRVTQHKLKLISGFTKRYATSKLVYYEIFTNPFEGILREKQLKGWRREKKIRLIEQVNPEWHDLHYIDQAEFSSLIHENSNQDTSC